MSDTKQRLLDGTLTTIREQGIAGVSARSIAATAGVNQALVFYHYGSIDGLLVAACESATSARVSAYSERFAAVTSLRELLDVGRSLHSEEQELGNVAVLAQLLAGSQHDEKLAKATARALRLWTGQIEEVLGRVLADSPFADVTDVPGLARALSAGFIGLELYDGVDPNGARRALAALEQLAVVMEVVDESGPVVRRAIRSTMKRKARRR